MDYQRFKRVKILNYLSNLSIFLNLEAFAVFWGNVKFKKTNQPALTT